MLSNKIIVVAGGAGLLGQTFVKAIVENDAIGVIADENFEVGEKAKRAIQSGTDGDKVDFISLNINSKKSLKDSIEKLKDKYGKIDALVNCAYPRNQNYGRHFFEVEYQDFCENVALHLGGYFLASQQFALFFKDQGYGNIVNIASIYGVVAPRFEIYKDTGMTMPVEYAAIKSAIIHLAEYMTKYLRGMSIRINTISPGGILDGQPSKFLESYRNFCVNKGMLNKEDLIGTLIYLLSDFSTYVNGQNIIVDDGFSL